jgi:hypothetical protein
VFDIVWRNQVRALINKLRVPLQKHRLRRMAGLKKKDIALLCHYGIGDTYIVLLLLPYLFSRFPSAEFTIMVKHSQREIPELFNFPRLRTIVVESPGILNDLAWCRPQFAASMNELRQGEIFYAHPYARFGDDLYEVGATLMDSYLRAFDISEEVLLQAPSSSRVFEERARARFCRFGLPENRTVLIAPDAVSSTAMPHELVVALEQTIRSRDLVPVILSSQAHYRHRAIEFSLGEAIPLAEMCGYVISARSGLCDLLSAAKVDLSIVYLDQAWGRRSDFFDATSLKNMKLPLNCRLFENSLTSDIQMDAFASALLDQFATG